MRLKIIAGNGIAILVIGLVSFFVVRSHLVSELSDEIDNEIANDQTLFDRSWRLSALQFVENVRQSVAIHDVNVVYNALDEDGRRKRAHESANRIAQWFRNPARGREGAPDIVAVTDETGSVIARDTDPNRMHGKSLNDVLPSLQKTLDDGDARHDAWVKKDEDKVLQTGIAPVRNRKGAILGAVVVGYDLSNGLAKSEAEVLGREVAFITEGEVYSSSLSGDRVDKLGKHLFGDLEQGTRSALEGKTTQPWSADLGEDKFVAVTAPLPMMSSGKVAYSVMANKSERLAIADSTYLVLILTILGLIGVGVYGFIIGSGFIKPLEQVEDGVLQVINGRTDYRINVDSPEFGGLAYRINQLINVFTGAPEEDEEGRVSQSPGAGSQEQGAWQGAAFSEGGGGASGGGSGDVIDDESIASQLAAEAEDDYYQRIYDEYVEAKKGLGEDVSNIPKDRFVQRLKGNAQSLAQKHGCRDVRFQVQTRGNQVVLRPVLIR